MSPQTSSSSTSNRALNRSRLDHAGRVASQERDIHRRDFLTRMAAAAAVVASKPICSFAASTNRCERSIVPLPSGPQGVAAGPPVVELSAGVLEDKIRGGMRGQILGGINGLVHEGKYRHEPGNVEQYTPGLPDGAWADDDTDIEWVYVTAMNRLKKTYLTPDEIAELWRAHINRQIWMSNRYVRNLLQLGILPPLTGRIAVNPWAEFNVSGHFVCETFGLMAPAMPQTACKIGLHYTHVTIDGEPAQTTQLFDTMIAVAFVENDIDKVFAAGVAAIDPKSHIRAIVGEVTRLWEQHPQDWRACRKRVKELYQIHDNGGPRDWAGIELNTASMIGALLYGRGDFVETLRLSFNFGWDTDCNAATVGTIVGVMKGRRWMDSQGWVIKDRYFNYSQQKGQWQLDHVVRDGMPMDETITSFEDKVIAMAKHVITEKGGEKISRNDATVYRIRRESPAIIERLPDPLDRSNELRPELLPRLAKWLTGSEQERARAAYLALCLGESERLTKEQPAAWHDAVEALRSEKFAGVRGVVSTLPVNSPLRLRAVAAGVVSARKPPPGAVTAP